MSQSLGASKAPISMENKLRVCRGCGSRLCLYNNPTASFMQIFETKKPRQETTFLDFDRDEEGLKMNIKDDSFEARMLENILSSSLLTPKSPLPLLFIFNRIVCVQHQK
jgi:hypothetical protein